MGTIVVHDRERLFRQLLIRSIAAESSHKVIGETAEFPQLHGFLKDYTPDFAIITLATQDDIEASNIAMIHAISPQTRLILLSNGIPRARLQDLVKLGAKGYINRDCELRELLHALDEAEQDRLYLDSTLITAEQLFCAMTAAKGLTARERTILPMLVRGYSNKAIGEELGIGMATVKSHVTHICQKLCVTSRQEVPACALRLGLISAADL